MIQQQRSLSRLPSSTTLSRLMKEGKWKGKEPLAISTPTQPPRRGSPAVRVTPSEDSTDSDQHSPKSNPSTSTSTSSSSKLVRRAPRAGGLRTLDTCSSSSLRSVSKVSSKPHGSPVQSKNTWSRTSVSPLRLEERSITFYSDQPSSVREPTTPYEDQFRRHRGDLLHHLGPAVPYMQAYDPTSLQCDALTTRLLSHIYEPGTPCFYKFQNRSAVTTALDLGCGSQLLWATTAAQFWPNAKIIGVDCIRPIPEVQIPSNVEFVKQNFLNKLSTIETESVDFVRMSCLGTSIPELEWPVVLTEVRRILRPRGVVEVIDDELYPAHLPKDCLLPIDRSFTEMLVKGYGMPVTPHETIEEAMEIAFGASEKKCFRVGLPSPNLLVIETEETRRGENLSQTLLGKRDVTRSVPHDTPAKAQRLLGLDNESLDVRVDKPSLIHPYGSDHWDSSDVRMVACGYMHKVLSCRASLIDFIAGSGAKGEKLDGVENELWAYERFYQEMLNLPEDDWNEFGGEQKDHGKEPTTARRTSADSYDSGYASQSSATVKPGKGKGSTSVTSDDIDSSLVRCFRVFHATKVLPCPHTHYL